MNEPEGRQPRGRNRAAPSRAAMGASIDHGMPAGGNGSSKSNYSRFVSLMKFLLPGAAVVLFVSLFVYSGFFDRDDKLDITFRDIATQNDDLRMVSPRVSGLNEQGRPYELSADTATQDNDKPNMVRLENIDADLKTDEASGWLTMNATKGLLDTDRQTLKLDDKVDLFTTQGYEFHAKQADVNFGKGTVQSDDEVWGQGPLGKLRADSMSADNESETIHFQGRVKATIYPDGGTTGADKGDTDKGDTDKAGTEDASGQSKGDK